MPRRAATSESVPMALEVVKQLQADGGTEARGIDRSAGAPGNVLLSAAMTGLPKDSVANATQIVARLLAIHYAIGALRLECPHQAGDAATGHRERAGQRWARTAAGVIRPPAFGELRCVD